MDSLSILQRFGSGELINDLAAALASVAEEVVATGNPGKVTIAIAISTQSQGDPVVIMTPAISRAMPKRESRGALFHALDGGLHRDDPRQIPLEFRTVDVGTGETRTVTIEPVERMAE